MANEFKAKNGIITPVIQVSSAGTAGAPAITKSDDLNTGIFFPSADTIAFAEGGTEVIRINSSANVGIGTSSQDEKLVVSGAITTTGQAAANKTSSGTFDFYATDNATRILSWGSSGVGGAISFWTGNGGSGTVERFRIATNGAIGLGGANYGTSGQVLTSNGSGSAPTWQTSAGGTGDVVGPASSVNNNIVLFNGTTGKLIKDSGIALPAGTLVGTTDTQTLTNKTLTFPIIDNIRSGYTTTATAAGTTTLTVTSNRYQRFTGTSTQTIVLPVTSTLATGVSYLIENASTGNLTVNSSGGNLVSTVIPGITMSFLCIGTTLTTAADWDAEYDEFATITGTGNVVLSTSPTLTTPAIGSGGFTLAGSSSGTTTVVTSATASGTVTIPAGTATLATTSNKLNAFAATTSAELAGVISDETGSGALVFATSPSLTTPVLGAATATSITASSTISGTSVTATSTAANTSYIVGTSYSVTGANTTAMVDVSGTWNTTGVATLLKANVTNTASGSGSKLIDLQTGGTTRFSVDTTGNTTLLGSVLVPVGTQTAPSYSVTGDTNTGIFFPAADTFAITTNGTEKVRINSNGAITSSDLADAVGYKGTPINSQSAAYTLVMADQGKTILHPSSDNIARTFTIPANSSVAFPVGTVINIINMINTLTIAITTDTMYLAGTGSTGSRTLAAYGIASILKIDSTTWIVSGSGLT